MLVEVIGIDEEEMVTEPRGLTGLFMEVEEAADLPGRRVALGMGCPLRTCAAWRQWRAAATGRGASAHQNSEVVWGSIFFWLQPRGV